MTSKIMTPLGEQKNKLDDGRYKVYICTHCNKTITVWRVIHGDSHADCRSKNRKHEPLGEWHYLHHAIPDEIDQFSDLEGIDDYNYQLDDHSFDVSREDRFFNKHRD